MPEEILNNQEILLKASSITDIQKLGNAISYNYSKTPEKPIIVRAIGAGAVNQAIKAITSSGQYFSQKGLKVLIQPSFRTLEEDSRAAVGTSKKTTALEFKLIIQKF